MSVQLSPSPYLQFFDNNGAVLSFGTVATYAAGTVTPQVTWIDATQVTPNTNPVVLDAAGRCSIWLDQSLSYKYIVSDRLGNIIRTVDSITTGMTGPVTLTAPIGTTPLTVNTNGAGNIPDVLVTGSVNGGIFYQVINTNSGLNATAEYTMSNGTHQAAIEMLGVNNVEGEALSIGTNSNTIRFGFAFGAAGFINYLGGNDVSMTLLGANAGVQLDMTPDSGSFTITYTGFASANTGLAKWTRMGNLIILGLPPGNNPTSNATTFTATGLPALIQPASSLNFFVPDMLDNSAGTQCQGTILAGTGTIIFSKGFVSGGAWTAAGNKGINNSGFTLIPYFLN